MSLPVTGLTSPSPNSTLGSFLLLACSSDLKRGFADSRFGCVNSPKGEEGKALLSPAYCES